MKWLDIQEKARALGVRTARVKKPELIRAIQRAEGNFPCFGTARSDCDQKDCCWRDDCLPKLMA